MTRKAIILVVMSLAVSCPIVAWDDCPFGLVNDPHPGKCELYEDMNSDGFCDHSQKNWSLRAEEGTPAVPDGAGPAKLPGQPEPAHMRKTWRPGNVPPPVPAFLEVTQSDISASVTVPRPPSPLRQRYPLWQIFSAVLALAAVTELMIKRNRRLALPLQAAWNWALGISFLFTFASSLVFVYPALLMKISINMGYWHSLAGLVMIAAGLYHFIRRFGSMRRGLFMWFRVAGHDRR